MRDLWKDPWKNDDAAAMTRHGGRITWGREGRCRGVLANPNPNQAFSRAGSLLLPRPGRGTPLFPSFLVTCETLSKFVYKRTCAFSAVRNQEAARPPLLRMSQNHVAELRNNKTSSLRSSRNIFLACSLLFTRRRRDPPPTCFAAPWLPRAVRHCCSFYVQAWRQKSGCYCCCDWQSLKGAAKDVETATPPKKAATPPHGCCG